MFSSSPKPLPDNTQHSQQTSMPPVGFELTISADERWQTYTLDRVATGTVIFCWDYNILPSVQCSPLILRNVTAYYRYNWLKINHNEHKSIGLRQTIYCTVLNALVLLDDHRGGLEAMRHCWGYETEFYCRGNVYLKLRKKLTVV